SSERDRSLLSSKLYPNETHLTRTVTCPLFKSTFELSASGRRQNTSHGVPEPNAQGPTQREAAVVVPSVLGPMRKLFRSTDDTRQSRHIPALEQPNASRQLGRAGQHVQMADWAHCRKCRQRSGTAIP